MYEDIDGDMKMEQNVFSGQVALNPQAEPSVWTNFYTKLSEIDAYNERNSHLATEEQQVFDSLQPASLFAQEIDAVLEESDRIFSGEEYFGKFLDL